MKKLIILLLFVTACAKQPVYVTTDRSATITLQDVNVGASANDGTGDPLRTAFQKVNSNNSAIESFAGGLYTSAEIDALVIDRVNDSLNLLRTEALDASDYLWLKADSNTLDNPITLSYFNTYGGGGTSEGSGGYEWTSFIIGTTVGAPSNADTSFTISDFAGDRIELSRGTTAALSPQWLNETATNVKTGYRFNASGTIVVRPAWSTGDRAYLKAVPSAYTDKIVLTGGESTLLDDIEVVYNLDETSGTATYDATEVYDAVNDISGKGYTGVLGYCYAFPGAATKINPGKVLEFVDAFSISFWIKSNSADNDQQFIISNMAYDGADWNGYGIDIDEGVVNAYVASGAAGLGECFTATGVDNDAWHHIVMTYDGTTIYVYKDNVKGAGTAHADAPAYIAGNHLYIGNNAYGTAGYDGYLDQIIMYSRALTDAEVTELYNSGNGNNYPF